MAEYIWQFANWPHFSIDYERQIKVVKKLLETGEGGFERGLSAKKYQGMVKGSRATLTRDLANLVAKGILIPTGERKATRYHLNWELAGKNS